MGRARFIFEARARGQEKSHLEPLQKKQSAMTGSLLLRLGPSHWTPEEHAQRTERGQRAGNTNHCIINNSFFSSATNDHGGPQSAQASVTTLYSIPPLDIWCLTAFLFACLHSTRKRHKLSRQQSQCGRHVRFSYAV